MEVAQSILNEAIKGVNGSSKKTVPLFTNNAFVNEQIEIIAKLNTLNVFIPDWNNRPAILPAALSLNGDSILSYQNMTAIIASPGLGKSSLCEAAIASYLNQNNDCLGFKVWIGCEGVIYIDFERTNLDVWNSFYRMCKRAGIQEGGEVRNVKIVGMRSIPRLTERLAAIEELLQNNPCSLLILDGAGDLVTDTNDLPQAIECRIFLRELTVKHNISILTTLHPNPNSNKPRGHIGSEILRESECVLLAKKTEGDARLLTTDFEHGKNRNNGSITAGYKWSDDMSMFISIDVSDIIEGRKDFKAQQKRKSAEDMAKAILPPLQSITNTAIIKAIMQFTTCSESTAKIRLKEMLEWNIVTKRNDGNYSLFIKEGSGFKEGSNGVQ